MNAWLEPDARRAALQEVEPFIDRSREQQVATSFSGWFTFGDVSGQVPPNWKQAMVVLLVLFPVVMLEILYLNPLLRSLNLAVANFIGNIISIAVLTWALMPRPTARWTGGCARRPMVPGGRRPPGLR